MTFTNTPSDRVQLRGLGELQHPGSCALCGSGNCEDGYVDLGIYYDYEGQMYLCVICVKQVAGVIDMIPSEEVQFMQAAAEELALKFKALEDENLRYRERLAAYDVLVNSVSSGFPAGTPSQIEEPTVESANESVSGTDSGEPSPKESTESAGHTEPVRVKRSNTTRKRVGEPRIEL